MGLLFSSYVHLKFAHISLLKFFCCITAVCYGNKFKSVRIATDTLTNRSQSNYLWRNTEVTDQRNFHKKKTHESFSSILESLSTKNAQLSLDISSAQYLEQMLLLFQLHFIFKLKTIRYIEHFAWPFGVPNFKSALQKYFLGFYNKKTLMRFTKNFSVNV